MNGPSPARGWRGSSPQAALKPASSVLLAADPYALRESIPMRTVRLWDILPGTNSGPDRCAPQAGGGESIRKNPTDTLLASDGPGLVATAYNILTDSQRGPGENHKQVLGN